MVYKNKNVLVNLLMARRDTAIYLLIFCTVSATANSPNEDKKTEILPPCQACKTVVGTFERGMAKTDKHHFGGGDAAWEEEKLGDYAKSETRLVEVQEQLCADIDRGQKQCYRLAENWEQLLEEWWYSREGTLHDWLCVRKVEYCCPEKHFGAECKPCTGYPNNICSNNGKCKGSGTRKGNGNCLCNNGYAGADCNSCATGYFEAYRDEKKLLCSKCHAACLNGCHKAGHRGCLECNKGWLLDPERGCLDIDECATTTPPCKIYEFCVNNDGSYSCLACDSSCLGCHGDGPDMCIKCADGYVLKDGLCISKQTTSSQDWTRYLTYLGLCIATCIIFQKNTLVASIIGISVAVYVAISEYVLNTLSNQNQFFQNSIDSFLKSMN